MKHPFSEKEGMFFNNLLDRPPGQVYKIKIRALSNPDCISEGTGQLSLNRLRLKVIFVNRFLDLGTTSN